MGLAVVPVGLVQTLNQVQGDGFHFRVTGLAVVLVGTDPESIFVASACEYGVAVQGDGSAGLWLGLLQSLNL